MTRKKTNNSIFFSMYYFFYNLQKIKIELQIIYTILLLIIYKNFIVNSSVSIHRSTHLLNCRYTFLVQLHVHHLF